MPRTRAQSGSDGPGGSSGEYALDDRKAAILNAVVAQYVETAQPVGSTHLTGSPGIEVSSATVRSEMSALESEGYLVQPHTSAGRVPTDKGYRFFVDHLARPGVLDARRRQEVRSFFAHVHGEVEDMLGRTSGLLAHLTDYAAVVVGPGHTAATVRSVQMVGLGERTALLIVVLSDGAVEKTSLELRAEPSEAVLMAAGAHLTSVLRDHTLSHRVSIPGTGDAKTDAAVAAAREGLTRFDPAERDHVFVGGSSQMAAAFDAFDTVRSVLSILEQQLVVVELIEDILDRGLSVAIGTEHGFEPLAECALVVAPLSIDGENAGTIGVLGPTRMRYPRALAAVQLVGRELSERLGGSAPGSETKVSDTDLRSRTAAPSPSERTNATSQRKKRKAASTRPVNAQTQTRET